MKNFSKNLVYLAGAVLSVAFGLVVYHSTGLHEATATKFMEYGLGAAIAGWFLINYRVAFFGHARPARARQRR